MTLYLCDVNIWLALTLSAHIHRQAANDWLAAVEERDSILFCRTTQQSFLRLLTNRALLARYGNPPLTNVEAWATYEALFADTRVAFRGDEPASLESTWRGYAARATPSPNVWTDAYLAAFALAGGYRMVTTDGGFRQYPGLDLVLLGGEPAAT